MRAVVSVLVIVFKFMSVSSAGVSPEQAKSFIESLVSEGIVYWKDKPYEEQVIKFKEVMDTRFDMDGIAKRVVGERLWRYMDASQKQAYLKAFRQMLLNRYSKKFSQYGGQRIVVTTAASSVKAFPIGVNSTQPVPQIVVTSELYNSGGSPVKIEWYVGEGNGKLTITDITLAGPSMVSTEQATFTAIQRNPETLNMARETCKNVGGDPNQCIANKLIDKVMEYMLTAD